ncbi:hypothetical protein BJY04DRAFT_188200 [Aspergillus karnatakaensis]|uniref:uncharacterized protein n=1 Tax=Aspergillus karnatakaensis TaxID=1810916 RepID=UPI003CCCD5B4
MRFALSLLALPFAASAWKVTTGYWESSEIDYCTSADLSRGQDVTVGDLPSNQRVFFFSDDECEDFEFSVTKASTTTLQGDIGSFQVLEFEPNGGPERSGL